MFNEQKLSWADTGLYLLFWLIQISHLHISLGSKNEYPILHAHITLCSLPTPVNLQEAKILFTPLKQCNGLQIRPWKNTEGITLGGQQHYSGNFQVRRKKPSKTIWRQVNAYTPICKKDAPGIYFQPIITPSLDKTMKCPNKTIVPRGAAVIYCSHQHTWPTEGSLSSYVCCPSLHKEFCPEKSRIVFGSRKRKQPFNLA